MKIYEFALKMRDQASSKVEKLNKLAGKTRSAFKRLSDQANKAATRVQERFPRASRAVATVGRAATKVTGQMRGLRQVVVSGVTPAFSKLRTTMLALGAAAALGVGVAVKESMGFNAQMSRVSAISNASAEDFALLRNKALEMGKSTRFSAKEAGQGLEFLGMAGFAAKDAASALRGVLDLAAASGSELGRTADIASNAISAFGLSASESDRVADVFAKTITSSNTNLEMMAESMKYLAPTARALGVSLEESASAVGILGDNGLQGSVATTTLASGFNRLAKPTRQMRIMIKGLGIEMFNAQGKFKGIAGMIQEVERATANMTDRQKQATIATLFGAEATKNILSLLNGEKKIKIDSANAHQAALMKNLLGEKRYQEAMKRGGEITLRGAEAIKGYDIVLQTAAGTAKNMAKVMEDNLTGDVTKAKSAFSGLMIEIGDRFDPFLRRITQGMTSVISDLGDNFGSYLSILSEAFAPLRKAFGEFKRDLSSALGLTDTFGNSAFGVKEVVQGIAQAVAFVTPFIVTMLGNIARLISTIATTFAPMKTEIETLLGGLRANLLMVSQDVWGVADSLIQALAPIIEVVVSVGNTIVQNFGQIWKAVVGVVSTILPYVHQLAASFRDNVNISGVLGRIMVGVTAIINGLRRVLHAVLRILTPIGKVFLWLGGLLLDIVGVAFEKLGEIAGGVFEGLGNLLNGLMDKINWVLGGIKKGLRFIGIMSREADSVAKKAGEGQTNNKSGAKPPSKKSNAEKLADEAKAKAETEKLKKLQEEIDRFKAGNSKAKIPVMSNTAFDKLITPSRKKSSNAASSRTSQNEESTDFTTGTNRITGGGSKQVNINISIGNIIGLQTENVNHIEQGTSPEINQSADFIVQEIVRKLNGALMVQEGV